MNTPTIYPRESSGANRFFLLSMLCISTVLLASCGGGSGEEQTSDAKSADGRKEALAVPPGWKGRAPTYEVINGITVPPEPAPSINNATLAGVDINNNGVRDDVERKIAYVANTSATFQIGLELARIRQRILTAPSPISAVQLDVYWKDETCKIKALLSAANEAIAKIATGDVLNTEARIQNFAKNIEQRASKIMPVRLDCR